MTGVWSGTALTSHDRRLAGDEAVRLAVRVVIHVPSCVPQPTSQCTC